LELGELFLEGVVDLFPFGVVAGPGVGGGGAVGFVLIEFLLERLDDGLEGWVGVGG
jgi:hypothetical protein